MPIVADVDFDGDPEVIVWRNVHGQYDWTPDGAIDPLDLDALCRAVANHSASSTFDVNRDQRVDYSDVDMFLYDVLRGHLGDLDDDDRFSSSDLIQLMQRGRFEQDTTEAHWSDGDSDCNGRFDSADLLYLLAHSDYRYAAINNDSDSIDISETVVSNQFDRYLADESPLLQADIDGDKDLDLMVNRAWYRNNGPRRTPVSHSALEEPFNAVGDLDGDGDIDGLVVGPNADSESYWVENMDGLGHFDTRHGLGFLRLSSRSAPRFVDWDGDHDLDLVAVRDEFPMESERPFAASVVAYENNGNAALHEAMVVVRRSGGSRQFDWQPFDIADFDGDGWVDIVTSDDAWYRNLRGSLTAIERIAMPRLPVVGPPTQQTTFPAVVAGDLDHDGDVDLIQTSLRGIVVFSYNDGIGRWTHALSTISANRFHLSDVDRDGHWELWLPGSLQWAEAETGWTDRATAGFAHFSRYPFLQMPNPPVFHDLNGDGRDELVAVSGRSVVAIGHETLGELSFTVEQPFMSSEGIDQILADDFDHDGRLDLAIGIRYAQPVWFRNLGDKQWSGPTLLDLPLWKLAEFDRHLDMDQDGDLDRVSDFAWRENQPGIEATDWPEHLLPAWAIGWWDMDADGDQDLVGHDSWWPMDQGQFTSTYRILPVIWSIADLADLDGDGTAELLTDIGNIVSQ